MDISRTSAKRVSASQRGFVTAQSNQATIRKPWKSLAAVAFGLLLSVPGLTQAQYRFSTIDVPAASRTAANGNSTHEIVGDFDDADGNTHGFVLNKGVFTTIDVPSAVATFINGINAPERLAGTYIDDGGTSHAFFENKGYFTTLYPPDSIRSQGDFTTFDVPGPDITITIGEGINNAGTIVGAYVANGTTHGFVLNNGVVFTTVDVPDAQETQINSIQRERGNRGIL